MVLARTPMVRRAVWSAVAVVASVIAAGCGGGGSDVPNVATLRGTSEATAARELLRGGGAEGAASGADAAGAKKLSPEQAILRFTKCLRDNGLDVPDPDVDSGGNLQLDFSAGAGIDPNDPVTKRAREACRSFATAIILSFDPGDIASLRDTLVRYAGCLRKQGYPVDDPNFLDRDGPLSDVDQTDPAFKRANVSCQPILADVAKVLNG